MEKLEISEHAIRRWKQRIENVSDEQALCDMFAALKTAKAKHFYKRKLEKSTFYIPTVRAVFVGSRGRIVTVLERGQNPFLASE